MRVLNSFPVLYPSLSFRKLFFTESLTSLKREGKKNGAFFTHLIEKIHRIQPGLGQEVKPSIDVAAKIAEVLEVSLDYLTGKSLHGLKDQHTLRRLEEITQLPPSAKDQIFMVVDALNRDFKTKQAYSH